MSNELRLIDNYVGSYADAYEIVYGFADESDRANGSLYISKKRQIALGQTGMDPSVWDLMEHRVTDTMDQAWRQLSYNAQVKLDWFRALSLTETNGVS